MNQNKWTKRATRSMNIAHHLAFSDEQDWFCVVSVSVWLSAESGKEIFMLLHTGDDDTATLLTSIFFPLLQQINGLLRSFARSLSRFFSLYEISKIISNKTKRKKNSFANDNEWFAKMLRTLIKAIIYYLKVAREWCCDDSYNHKLSSSIFGRFLFWFFFHLFSMGFQVTAIIYSDSLTSVDYGFFFLNEDSQLTILLNIVRLRNGFSPWIGNLAF